jgi:hypothetical protein
LIGNAPGFGKASNGGTFQDGVDFRLERPSVCLGGRLQLLQDPVDGELPIVPQKRLNVLCLADSAMRQIRILAGFQSRAIERVAVQSVDTREVRTWPLRELTSHTRHAAIGV